ncbi:Alanine dehydrogenase/PNT, N-terminal domain [Filimonas lacunae]|uniref:Alanine dehydrogenase/PNT, N-terminal domain n=1 Tax=Filimonas lacunae TaxID=477680 RepID=A0A173MA63_9BACT|nr:NAD(P)-dependent oxidoreductase [Filimonas lacunae]BAV04400.1 lysine ketoglutarate reductase [Filimonas lacunae]SIT31298.1 Alanine dehydrogenase/PNT, N-terminal domain [Filimonas lacunae]
MLTIGLIKEGKVPTDNRVALTPPQCKWLLKNRPDVRVLVQSSPGRCYSDAEYRQAGVTVTDDVSGCDILLGIKEVPIEQLLPHKTYLFFSHTKKKQPYNRAMLHTMMDRGITLIDYECLEHEDGQRIIGFGFFAGVVGAHNGMMAYGNRTGAYQLGHVYQHKDYRALIHTYFGLKLPNIKIAVTGSGRVAHGILEIMNLMDVQEVEPEDYLGRKFTYPVYVHLKGRNLYRHQVTGEYMREHFHHHPEEYDCLFPQFSTCTDILMNGTYWAEGVPRLFEWEHLLRDDFAIQTIADITDDKGGSIPCNLGDATIQDPVYGVNKRNREKTPPYLIDNIDIMAVGNLPNELPRDASRYFGEQLIKHILADLLGNGSDTLDRATILEAGKLTPYFDYLQDYAAR